MGNKMIKLKDLLLEVGEAKNPYKFQYKHKYDHINRVPYGEFYNTKFDRLIYDIDVIQDGEPDKLNVIIDYITEDATEDRNLEGVILVSFDRKYSKDPYEMLNLGIKHALRATSTMIFIIRDAIKRLGYTNQNVTGIAYHPATSKHSNAYGKSSGAQQRDKLYDVYIRKGFNVVDRDTSTLKNFKIYWIKV